MIRTLPGGLAQTWYDPSPAHGLEPGWYGSIIHTDGSGAGFRTGPHDSSEAAEAAVTEAITHFTRNQ
ncbi:hypothetical protein [Streptomyces tendae]|uniref:hypothetical protein n=1 Tax=Streptomyces tendae TaxID=1932 RepID=UPI00365DEE5F